MESFCHLSYFIYNACCSQTWDGYTFNQKITKQFSERISLIITDILDSAVLPVTVDYVTSPRQLLTLLCYSKDKYWSSDKVLSLLPRWRSMTGGGSLSDRQCLKFLIGNTPLLTSRFLHKSLRIADPGDIGKGLCYNFSEPVVLQPDFLSQYRYKV